MVRSRFVQFVPVVVVAGILVTGGAPAADAGGRNWKTVATVAGAELQLCTQPTSSSGPYLVKARVDASDAARKVFAIVVVNKNKTSTGEKWDTSAKPGEVSDTGTVRLPRDDRYAVSVGIGDNHSGDSGLLRAGDIARC